MAAYEDFRKLFSEGRVTQTYTEFVALSTATGIDNLSPRSFWPLLIEQAKIISRKVKFGNYKFTKYKLKLISKGRSKAPREISIPSIRDRLVLKVLCNLLISVFSKDLAFELPQKMVRRAKQSIFDGSYDAYIKLDVSNFYPSIAHDKLISQLKRRIRKKEILKLVLDALTNPTVADVREVGQKNVLGVPQGLSISNVLAAVYLAHLDKKHSVKEKYEYFRYVDDVLVVCKLSDLVIISSTLISDFKKIGLTVHTPIPGGSKSTFGKIDSPFDYLGYRFNGSLVSARAGSVERLKESLAAIFSSYKHAKSKNAELLKWKINLRITGCVFQMKSKGWMFFFSEINDESLLHNLDRHVRHLAKRFAVDLTFKRFVRAYFEISRSRHSTSYIPNFDTYTLDDMRAVLATVFDRDVSKMLDVDIEYEFRRRILKQTRELLTDIQPFGYLS